MKGLRFDISDEMLIAIVLWVCLLPLLLLLALPILGPVASAMLSLALLALFLVACWLLCGRIFH